MIPFNANKGFTLVEVLLSIFFVGMLALVIASVMEMSINLFRTLDETVDERNHGSKILAIIRRDLKGIVDLSDQSFPLQVREDDHENLVLAFVTAGRVTANEEGLVAPYSESGYASQFSKINSSLLVLYRRHDWFVDEEPLRGGVWELLSDRVRSYEIEFHNPETPYNRAWPDGQVPTHAYVKFELVKPEIDLETLSLDPEIWPVDVFEEVVQIK